MSISLRLLSVSLFLVASFALPADAKPNYNGLSDRARSQLQSFKSYMKDCSPDKPPHKGVSKHVAGQKLDECERIIKNQRKRLDRIKGDDLKHAVFKEFSAYQARLEAALIKWRADYKATQANEQKLQKSAYAMKKSLRSASSTLWFLKGADEGKSLGERSTAPSDVAKKYKAVSTLAELATACKTTYAPVLADKDLSRRASADRTPKPAEACAIAAAWKESFSAWLPKAAAAYADIKARQFQGFVDKIKQHGTATDHILELLTAKAMDERAAKVLADYRAVAAELGVELGDDVFQSWKAIAAAAPAVIKAAGKEKRPRDKASNSKVTRAVKSSLKGSGLKFKKLGLDSKQGRIIKNSVGIPLRKQWSGDLLVKKKGEKACRLYRIGPVAQYKGGGRYQKAVSRAPNNQFKIAACK